MNRLTTTALMLLAVTAGACGGEVTQIPVEQPGPPAPPPEPDWLGRMLPSWDSLERLVWITGALGMVLACVPMALWALLDMRREYVERQIRSGRRKQPTPGEMKLRWLGALTGTAGCAGALVLLNAWDSFEAMNGMLMGSPEFFGALIGLTFKWIALGAACTAALVATWLAVGDGAKQLFGDGSDQGGTGAGGRSGPE